MAHRLYSALRQLRRGHWQRPFEGHKPSELTLLICLARKSHEHEAGLKVSEISKFLGLTPPTVTQLVNSLEAKQLVQRQADPTDRRVVRINLTKKGFEITHKTREHMDGALNRLVEYLGEEDSNRLADLLLKVKAFNDENPPPNLDKLQMNGDDTLD